MKAKDKAEELVEKFYIKFFNKHNMSANNSIEAKQCVLILDKNLFEAKQCALIAVDEIIEILWHTHKNEIEYRYWQEVKQEIIKL